MASTNLTIRIDSDLKEKAAGILAYYGLDLSTATRAFFTQIVNTGSVPLSFDYEEPNEESLAAIRQTEDMINSGKGDSFTSGHDLIQAAMA